MHKPKSAKVWLAKLDHPSADRDYQPGHARILALLNMLPLHTPRYRIRIAGTNGKGSTAHMLATALQDAGFRVGLFTSPHILCFNERIRIQGKDIAGDKLIQYLEHIVPKALANGASYFETATALALQAFSDADVDIEILEAGVGARFDATTAVPADLAILTPIALDHQGWLGDTLQKIAFEKSWVSNGCSSCFSAIQPAIVSAVLRKNIPSVRWVESQTTLSVMPGKHQQVNASLALAAAKHVCHQLQSTVSDSALTLAIENTVVPGRLQQISLGKATIWLDAAHNAHAIETLLPSLPMLADPLDAIFIMTREDRCLDDTIPLLQPFAKEVVNISQCTDDVIFSAFEQRIRQNTAATLLLLGSFTTVAAGLRWLEQRQ